MNRRSFHSNTAAAVTGLAGSIVDPKKRRICTLFSTTVRARRC